MKWVSNTVRRLESHVKQPWYPAALGFTALIDNFIFVIPMVAVLITSVFTVPKRWFSLALFQTIGSSIGVALFAWLISHFGIHFLEAIAPQFMNSHLWHESEEWVGRYGLWALFGVSALPMTDHPVIAILALHHVSIIDITLVNLVGKAIKYFLFSWLASHAPGTLLKFKIVKKEKKDFQA